MARVSGLLLLALCLLALVAVPAAHAQDTRPNVVVVMTDDQTVRDLRSMTQTRRVIARRGVTFRRSYVSYPVCCPSRATFLTGQYAHNHRVLGNYLPSGGYQRFDKLENLPVWLRRAGYHTVHVGRYLNGYGTDTPADVPPGWNEWYASIGTSAYRMWGFAMNENGRRRTYGNPFAEDPSTYQTDVLRDRALDAIRRRAGSGQPFFLSVAFLAPHMENTTIADETGIGVRSAPRHRGGFAAARFPRPRGFNERDVSDKPPLIRRRLRLDSLDFADIRDRWRWRQESLLAVDDAVQAITAELEATGAAENTYVIFTSDNGFMQGEHRVGSGKVLPYDPSTRVPLLIRGPGVPEDEVSGELVGNIDLTPTILRDRGGHARRARRRPFAPPLRAGPRAALQPRAATRDRRAPLRARRRRGSRGVALHPAVGHLPRRQDPALAVGGVPRRQPRALRPGPRLGPASLAPRRSALPAHAARAPPPAAQAGRLRRRRLPPPGGTDPGSR